LTKAEVRRLRQRVERLAEDPEVPSWLMCADVAEKLEYLALLHARTPWHPERRDFVRRMRAKYPNMPLTIDEEIDLRVEVLKRDKDLARREGLTEEDQQD
jgi:hypothetical protein